MSEMEVLTARWIEATGEPPVIADVDLMRSLLDEDSSGETNP
jgi:hypothetical protein